MFLLYIFIGFLFGITGMAILATSGQAGEREKVERNNQRLAVISRWYRRHPEVMDFPDVLEGWVNEEE